MSTVYGPTTIDRQNGDTNDGLSNNSLLFSTQYSRNKLSHRIIRLLPLLLGFTFLILGLLFLIGGGMEYASSEESQYKSSVLFIIGFSIIASVSSIFFIWFLKRTGRLYCCNKKTHLDVAGKHVSTNPSTDMLVSATYPPVSDVAYQQQPQGDTENSRLMAQENGTISNEDADRMVESDPRIVLRPLKSAHEDC